MNFIAKYTHADTVETVGSSCIEWVRSASLALPTLGPSHQFHRREVWQEERKANPLEKGRLLGPRKVRNLGLELLYAWERGGSCWEWRDSSSLAATSGCSCECTFVRANASSHFRWQTHSARLRTWGRGAWKRTRILLCERLWSFMWKNIILTIANTFALFSHFPSLIVPSGLGLLPVLRLWFGS